MTVTTLRPNADVTNNWTKSTGTQGFALIDDAVTEPTDASISGDGAQITGTTTAGTEQEVGFGTFTLDADTVSEVTLWVHRATGAKRGIDVRLLHGTTQLGSTLSIGHNQGAGWQSIVFTGSIAQAQIDDLRAEFVTTTTAGGGGAAAPTVYAAYINVTHAASIQNINTTVATESDAAIPSTTDIGVLSGLPAESDAGLPATPAASINTGVVAESDSVIAGAANIGALSGVSTESDAPLSGAADIGIVSTLSAESDLGIATSYSIEIPTTLPAEADQAIAGTVGQDGGDEIVTGVAAEADQGLVSLVTLYIVTMIAQAVSFALPSNAAHYINSFLGVESSEGLASDATIEASSAIASESESGIAGTPSVESTTAIPLEDETVLAGFADISATTGAAGESDQAIAASSGETEVHTGVAQSAEAPVGYVTEVDGVATPARQVAIAGSASSVTEICSGAARIHSAILAGLDALLYDGDNPIFLLKANEFVQWNEPIVTVGPLGIRATGGAAGSGYVQVRSL